jgi:hypothetical protein
MKKSRLQFLITGDLLAIAILTMIGFATHEEVGLSFVPRMLAIFVPLALSWAAAAWVMRLYEPGITSDPRQLWRPLVAVLFAGPLAVVLRGFLLNAVVIPIFALVLSATAALGMLIWRAIWRWLENKLT